MNTESLIQTIAFYNTENLFDIFVDKSTIDRDFLPTSSKRWTKKRYDKKIEKLGSVISKIGFDDIQRPPVLIGLAEVENDAVLNDLIRCKDLAEFNYGYIHFNSLDERGIDVALLYNKDEFEIIASEAYPLYIENEFGVRDFTRDILIVTGYLNKEKIHVLVNHWPSRHTGSDQTEYKRVLAADRVGELIENLRSEHLNPNIIVMGDFNDNPTSKSILKLKNENGLFNAMESVWSYSRGSVNHNFTWIQFDQIFISTNLLDENLTTFQFEKADIFDDKFLKQYEGKFKGQPFRTFVGTKYKGGFSDHFPVYIQLKK